MPRPSTGSRSESVRVIAMEIIRERGVQDVWGIDPGPLLRSVPLPVDEVLQHPASASRIQDLPDSVRLLAIHHDGSSPRRSPPGPPPLSDHRRA